jgi:predicted CXXCH cytochrome family protein
MTRLRGKGKEVAISAHTAPAGRASIVEPRTHKEVRTVRRLALLLAGGALWLILAASAAYADGGPHQLTVNSGTAGLSGDCAACHRAHTAQAADLLKASMPGLCLTCHNGTGATTDVVDGKQFVPDGSGDPTTGVLGALRGGGFSYALIDTAAASRMTYSRAGGVLLTYGAAPASGSVTLTWAAVPSISFTGGAFTFNATDSAATIQTAANTFFGTSTAYSGSTTSTYMSGLPAGGANAIVTKPTTTTVVFTWHNAFRTVRVPLPTLTNNTTPTTVTLTDSTTVSATAHVGVLASGVATTSTHEGAGTVWGNGPQGSASIGATGVALECTNCHNPHGNGQYRILNTQPGEDWNSAAGVANWVEPVNAVEVKDVGSAATTKNYTVLPGVQASDVVNAGYTATQGDYFRRKYDPSGAANWTNFYLKVDDMNTGWNNILPTNKAANGGVAPANTNGLMTAWCITCHTRYNGYAQNGTASLNAQTPLDNTYMFKHGTTGTGCEQCHVSHGSNAAMTAQFSSTALFPDGVTTEDSALLKVDNRGTCNLCHDPTGTVDPGVKTGTAPAAITPGP